MSENDKIYELFRQNEHKLDEKPSRRAWERLDARLDRHEAKRIQPSWYKYGGMVAAVLILVCTATLLTLNNQSSNQQMAMKDMDMISTPLLDLKNDGNSNNYKRIVAYQNEYKNRASRILENELAGDLRPRNNNRKRTNPIDISVANSAPTIDLAMLDVSDDNITEGSYNYTIIENSSKEPLVNADKALVEEETKIVEEADLVEMEEEPTIAVVATEEEGFKEEPNVSKPIVKEEKMEEIAAVRSATTAPAAPMPTAPSAPSAGNADYDAGMALDEAEPSKKSKADDYNPSYAYDVNTEDDYPGMKDEKTEAEESGLSSFNWLLGSWKGKVNGSTSTEKWSKIDERTYIGTGKLGAGGVALFSENMELKQTNAGTYLTVSLDKNNKRVAYRMSSNSGDAIVFVNNSVSYPKKIVLKKNSNNSFSFTMQNGDTTSLNNEQVRYLENRNSIVGEKLVRSLKKVN